MWHKSIVIIIQFRMGNVVIMSFVAGVVGTGLGGIIGVLIGGIGKKVTSSVLSIAGGIMLAVVFFDLIPESLELAGDSMIVLLGLIWGVVILWLLNIASDAMLRRRMTRAQALMCIVMRNNEIDSNKLKTAGLFLFLAVALHNIPEGIAIGTTGVVGQGMCISISIVICIHNIPEGMAIAVPMVAGGGKKIKSIVMSVLAGAFTIIGGVIGIWLGNISGVVTSFFLAFAAGAMLQVTMCEMLPDSIAIDCSKRPFVYTLLGVIIGFALVRLL